MRFINGGMHSWKSPITGRLGSATRMQNNEGIFVGERDHEIYEFWSRDNKQWKVGSGVIDGIEVSVILMLVGWSGQCNRRGIFLNFGFEFV